MATSKGTRSVARAAENAARRTSGKSVQKFLDSFQNVQSRIGLGTDNQSSYGTYGLNPITRNRIMLDMAYRGSWIVRNACQNVADDMTSEGFILGSDLDESDKARLQNVFNNEMFLWDKLRETIQWARLFGGAGAVLLIDGQDFSTPLKVETISRDQFCGLLPMDRWLVTPSLSDLVTDMRSPDFGKPKYYRVEGQSPLRSGTNIHHSRFLRFDGDDLSYYMKLSENLWGMSVLEPIWDRLTGFDSTTQGIAQLVYRASVRVLKLENWKEIAGTGGKLLDNQMAALNYMRQWMGNEGITVIDSKDSLDALTYAFTGLDSVLIQMGQQLSGALGIPMVRLFGQSPTGLNSTGESDIKMYDDSIKRLQQRRLRSKVEVVLQCAARSRGIKLPDDFSWEFAPLRSLSDLQKATNGATITQTVLSGFEAGVITKRSTVLKELKQSSHLTGIWTNISEEDIEQAEKDDEMAPPPIPGTEEGEAPPEASQFLPGVAPPDEEPDDFLPGSGAPADEEDSAGAFQTGETEAPDGRVNRPLVALRPVRPERRTVHNVYLDQNLPGRETVFAGHRVIVEVEKGDKRTAGSSGGAVMAAPYGYFPGTTGNDGDAVDVFLGPNEDSKTVYVIDQRDPDSGEFHQHKVFLGFDRASDAQEVFLQFYADGRGSERLMKGHEYTLVDFDRWLGKYRNRSVGVA